MNTLAHGLLGVAINPKQDKTSIKYAVFYSLLPDLIPLSLIGIYLLISGNSIPHTWSQAPNWYFQIYSLFHSLVVWIIIFLSTALILKKIQWVQAFWLLHILFDIVGHKHFTTAFLYPISNYQYVSKFSWEENPFLLLSFIIPVIAIGIRYYLFKKNFT